MPALPQQYPLLSPLVHHAVSYLHLKNLHILTKLIDLSVERMTFAKIFIQLATSMFQPGFYVAIGSLKPANLCRKRPILSIPDTLRLYAPSAMLHQQKCLTMCSLLEGRS